MKVKAGEWLKLSNKAKQRRLILAFAINPYSRKMKERKRVKDYYEKLYEEWKRKERIELNF